MSEERKGLVREEGSLRPRTGRLERARTDRLLETRSQENEAEPADERTDEVRSSRRRDRVRRGRPEVMEEVQDLGRGGSMMAVESAAIALDIVSHVLRGAVDRAFDEDYSSPGEVVRGVANEADMAVFDLVDELRAVPRRLDRRFEESIRSPRADRGERRRRDDEERVAPADRTRR